MLAPDPHPDPTVAPGPNEAAGDFTTATATLYRAFADVAFRPDMPRCEHCVSAADVTALDAPPQNLDAELVARFVTKAGTTWGASEDLRRVAPRALHLAAEHRLPVNRSVVLDQLARADWARWPAHHVDAMCRFLLAEWERLLLSPPRAGHSAHRWLRQTATAVADLEPFLANWQRVLSVAPGAPAVHLAVLMVNSELRPDFPDSITDLFDSPAPSRLDPTNRLHVPATGAPDRADRPRADLPDRTDLPRADRPERTERTERTDLPDQLATWLTAPAIEEHLRQAEIDLAHTADARRLTLALERQRRYRAARNRAG